MTAAISVKEAVERASAQFGRRPLLVCTDFDGTLSTIVMDPWAAAILPLARTALRRLAGMPGVSVVVLSGRTAWDVAARVRVGNVTYLGNHGMERGYLARGRRPETLKVSVVGASEAEAALAARLADEVAARINEPWLIVERKPPTVAFHYRQAPDVAAAGSQVARWWISWIQPGCWSGFPAGAFSSYGRREPSPRVRRFSALLDELRPASVLMLGDDVSDAQAFAVLRAEREAGHTDGVAVAIQARAEVPPEVAANADLVLGSPHDAARLLSALSGRVRATGA